MCKTVSVNENLGANDVLKILIFFSALIKNEKRF